MSAMSHVKRNAFRIKNLALATAWLLAALLAASCSQSDLKKVDRRVLERPLVDFAPGLAYTNYRVASSPTWSIHVLRVDRSHAEFSLQSVHASGKALGLSPLSEQIKSFNQYIKGHR